MKRFNVTGLGLLVCCVGIQTHASVVYEGFDYTAGDPVVGEGGGNGWTGNWDLGGGSNPSIITAGLTFDEQSVVGGAAQRPARAGNGAISRTISGASQATLTGDDSTIWFSVLMRSFLGSTGSGATDGFALNSYGTLVLGDAPLTGGAGFNAAPMTAGGNAIGVGFAGTGEGPDFSNIRLQGVVYTNGAAIENTAERLTVGSNTVMVVGKVEWADAGATNDTVTLYNVSDPLADLTTNEVFSTMVVNLDQSSFNVVSIGDAQTSVFDEIRFGTSPYDVGMVPVNTNAPVVMIEYAADVVTVGATNLVYAGTNYLQYSADLVNGSWSNLYSAVGVTEASWEIATSNSSGAVFYRIEAEKQ